MIFHRHTSRASKDGRGYDNGNREEQEPLLADCFMSHCGIKRRLNLYN